MWKLFQRALGAAVLGACVVGTAVPVSAAEKDKVTFVLDWIIYGRHTPYFVAVEKGIFEKNNIEAKVERGYGSAVGLRRLGANQADFLFADFGGLILARANENLKAKMIALIAIHATYWGPEISRPGTRIPRMRTAIALGARLNQVIE